MEVRSLGFRTDLMVRRLAGSTIVDLDRYIVVATPDNPTFHWGNFLVWPGPPGDGDLEQWMAAFQLEFPDATHATFGVDDTEVPRETDGPWSSIGLEAELSVVLTSTRPPACGPPSDAPMIRPLRSEADWSQELELRVVLDSEEAPLVPGHRAFLERSTGEARRLVELGHAEYFGAFIDDRLCSVVGIASDGRGMARYQNVGTHPTARRRGLASALLARAGEFAVDELRAHVLVIVADADGRAADLYRSVGFTDVEGQWGMSGTMPT